MYGMSAISLSQIIEMVLTRVHEYDRFFVASQLKSMLAHIVLSYDVKMEDN